MRLSALIALALVLSACAPQAKSAPDPATLVPANAALATLYSSSCQACHASPESGAPVVQDAAAWEPRWKQGEDVMLDHVIQGIGAMPPGGQCADCTSDDYRALIRFLAGKDQ